MTDDKIRPLEGPCTVCGEPTEQTCPTCRELALQPARFCSQKCFAPAWKEHNDKVHKPAYEARNDAIDAFVARGPDFFGEPAAEAKKWIDATIKCPVCEDELPRAGTPQERFLCPKKECWAQSVKVWKDASLLENDVVAQVSLGLCRNEGLNGLSRKGNRTQYFFKRAAWRGHIDAMYGLAWCYYRGFGTKYWKKAAFSWFAKAAM